MFLRLFIPGSPAHSADPQKRIYIAPDDHTDYMWTADEETYRQAFLEMTDYYLRLADSTANLPPQNQSRWNCDGSFWMWAYEKNRPAADFQRLIDRIRSGHISVPLTALVSCYGATPTEAVLRGMYYAGSVERRFNLRFPLAVAMENQTLPYGLGSLWAGAGAKYSWRGICNCATRLSSPGNREHPLYWWVGPDDSRILMKWYPLISDNKSAGGYAEARDPEKSIEAVESSQLFDRDRYPYDALGLFGKGWDDLKTLSDEFVTVARKTTTAGRQVLVSNQVDFFQDIETNYSRILPSLSVSFGNEWDLYSASMSEVSARVRRSVEMLRTAEAVATLVSLKDPSFMAPRKAARDQAWMDLGIYWEHDWTADGPVSRSARADWQHRIAGEIEQYVDSLKTDATQALAGMIRKNGSAFRFYVFNPLSWSRSDFVDLPCPETEPVHVVDLSTGEESPSQFLDIAGKHCLRIQALDIPSVGYKVFEVRPGKGRTFSAAASFAEGVAENEFYKITFSGRGAIIHLIDKKRGNLEFARTIDGRTINDLGLAPGKLKVEDGGPVTLTLVAESDGPLKHTSRLTLFRNSPRIDLRNEIQQNFADSPTWSFAFNLNSPDVWHEELGAVIRAKLLPEGGHYSPRNARYDWLTLNHFADMSVGGLGITLSNADCAFMQLGKSTPDWLDTRTSQIAILAGGQVDGPKLGIPKQGGDTYFLQRFALQTHDAFDRVAAMRFALEHQNPLIAAAVKGGTAFPEKSFSLVTLSQPSVFLWALKPAEEGVTQGIIARVWNLASGSLNFSLKLDAPLSRATRTTHIETDLEEGTVVRGALSARVASSQLQTYRLRVVP